MRNSICIAHLIRSFNRRWSRNSKSDFLVYRKMFKKYPLIFGCSDYYKKTYEFWIYAYDPIKYELGGGFDLIIRFHGVGEFFISGGWSFFIESNNKRNASIKLYHSFLDQFGFRAGKLKVEKTPSGYSIRVNKLIDITSMK